jgi:hypothetical protein
MLCFITHLVYVKFDLISMRVYSESPWRSKWSPITSLITSIENNDKKWQRLLHFEHRHGV